MSYDGGAKGFNNIVGSKPQKINKMDANLYVIGGIHFVFC